MVSMSLNVGIGSRAYDFLEDGSNRDGDEHDRGTSSQNAQTNRQQQSLLLWYFSTFV